METNGKPTTGKLLRFYRNGKVEVLEENLPFPVLQKKKKGYIEQGILKKNLKITYYYGSQKTV